MISRKITFLMAILIVVTGIIISGVLSNQKKPMRRNNGGSKIPPVKTLTVKNSYINTNFDIGGHLTAFDKVDLYAEVSGILKETPTRFKEGVRFAKGDVLIKIDDSVFKNQVLAQKSSLLNQLTLLLPDLSIDFPESAKTWQNYLHEFDIEKTIPPLPSPASDQERYYIASRNIYNQYYLIKSQEATLAKYTISAPYDGIVTESNINPGTLVRMGQKLGEFTNTELYELEAFAGIYEVRFLKVGDPVTLTTEDAEGEFKGTIQRINQVIDPKSQTIKVYILTRDKRLKDGMYCTASVTTEKINNAFRIPRNLLIGTDKLYSLNPDSTLSLIHVSIAADDDESVVVQNLSEGTLLLGQPLMNIYEGMKIEKMILN